MQLNSLPLSSSAKVDPGLMERLENSTLLQGTAERSDGLDAAKRLLTIFQDILHNTAMTEDDNFFLAGRHSLLGMELVTRLHTMFGVELTFPESYEASTVKSLV
jgi:iturin family lipopeptide synthetase B